MTVIEVSSDTEFNDFVLNKNDHNKKYIFVDFFAPWCGPCRNIAPYLEELSEKYGEHICFLKVNIDDVEEVAKTYDVKSLPTFMWFESGKLESEFEPIIGASKTKVENQVKYMHKKCSGTKPTWD